MCSLIGRCALIGMFASSACLIGQTTASPTFLQGVSTGLVTFTLGQTAQLNVVNLNPVAGTPAATATICTVQLQFFDGSGGLLKQTVINNVSPGASASLTLKREEAPNQSVPRFAFRGVVRTNPVATPGPTPVPGTNSPVIFAGCPVKTTLEIFNDETGYTQLVISDVQSFSGGVIPLMLGGRN